jgi:hypothetical protein
MIDEIASSVLPSPILDHSWTTRVQLDELGGIVHAILNDEPHVVVTVVLSNFSPSYLAVHQI